MIYHREKKVYYEDSSSSFLKFLYYNPFGRILLKITTLKPISKIGGFYMNTRLSKWMIKGFVKKNNIDMSEYEVSNYKCFNEFFIRKIKKNKRPISKDENLFVSPADSKLLVYKIDDEVKLNIKNSIYTVSEILKDDELAKEYKNGYCLVFRLCVDDYHHYHFVDDGKIIGSKKINGVLNTVQPIADKKCRVFSENAREVTILDTKNLGKVIEIEVGALMVGKIVNRDIKKFKRGEEKGYFCYGGSTVVLLLKDKTVKIDKDILDNSKKLIETKIKLGEVIGRRK